MFEATDPEGKNADIRWSVIGVDANRFIIVDIRAENADADAAARATLRFTAPSPSFEAMDSADGDNVYVVVVRATDGSSSSSKTMSVTVRNIEEPGKIGLSQLEPQEGIAITARLSDPDGDISATKWQWYRGAVTVEDADTDPVNGIQADELTARTDDTKCDDDTTTDCWIGGATSSTYIPKATDAGSTLTVVATYVDAFVTDSDGDTVSDDDGDIVIKTSDNEAVVRPNANDQPSFLDDDPASRSVDENAKGASVGDPVTATDEQPLLYTLSGDGSDAFKVDGSGQISTAEKLDYETQSSYTIMLTATDPSLASASIMVNITVNDADDGAAIEANVAPEFGSDTADRSVAEDAEAGANVGDPVVATDANTGDSVTYSLSGDDAGSFAIWTAAGQITVAEGATLDYETKNAYAVVVTAADGSGAADSITVNISVTDIDENIAPAFADESATFSVAENTGAGSNVGDPVVAMDADEDELMYALSGDGARSFAIWPSGQITVAEGATLDYESQTSHMVTATATDGKGGSASIAVTVNVSNVGLDNAYDMNDDGAISKDEAVAAVNGYFLDEITRDEVLVVLGHYFAASEDDAAADDDAAAEDDAATDDEDDAAAEDDDATSETMTPPLMTTPPLTTTPVTRNRRDERGK